jgi:transposase-like protein
MNFSDGYSFEQTWEKVKFVSCPKCNKNNVVHQSHEYSQANLREEHYKCKSCNNKWIDSKSIH